ncbi:PLDc N-terminal domain-containing protein [Microbacterium sp. TNHR37B]|uniref:PLDc N-terminal domain-containing protein n=1 Tax=Microbacterium sp. TNHR37B TaxID=1775956 RepID=UPI0007B19DFE|nr:PLDc N-terminal domain-containing protein [Microbacterium sp. TNHR37B]KZE91459.1 Cardiolipin synthase [Microbacterium sp. TNHR37B]
MPYVFSLLVLVGMVFAVVDIILRDEGQVRHLPKIVWLFLVILLPLLGTILWFAIGREYAERQAPRPPQFAPWASEPAPPATAPRDTRTIEQQLADLEREIEEDRLRAEIARRRAQQQGTAD